MFPQFAVQRRSKLQRHDGKDTVQESVSEVRVGYFWRIDRETCNSLLFEFLGFTSGRIKSRNSDCKESRRLHTLTALNQVRHFRKRR